MGKGSIDILENRNTKVGVREIPTLKNDTLFVTDKEKADSLQDFYKSVFQPVLEAVPHTEHNEGQIDIMPHEIARIIMSLGSNKAGGMDGLTAKFLKLSPHQHAKYLYSLAVRILEEGKVPSDWKTAVVIPIFKGGEKGRLDCYRPISLTSLASRIGHIPPSELLAGKWSSPCIKHVSEN
jgi:hypothetical protein